MQSVAIAWHVFVLHHRAFDLGLVGLALFLPAFALVLVTGVLADRYDRRAIVIGATLAELLAAVAFLSFVVRGEGRLWIYLTVLVFVGVARAFAVPAERSFLVTLVAEHAYVRTQAAYASVRQIVVIGGPATGGALLAIGTPFAFGAVAVLLSVSTLALTAMRVRRLTSAVDAPTLRDALGGLRFIRAQPIILAAISLDLFAVLFGGATALLPVYADTILRVGPVGLGVLRSAPAIGAFVTALSLSRRPPRDHVGRTLIVAVAGFGIATIVFGLSHSLALSLVALALTGATDMVSVVIRSGLVQLNTPDAMRGRVNAVENVFIGASNELGMFESGTVAAAVGTVGSVVLGGLGTLAIVLL